MPDLPKLRPATAVKLVVQDGSELAEALTLVLAKGWGSPEDVTELNLAVVQASSELASESNFRYNA